MTDKDTRPLVSPAPEWAQQLTKDCCDKLDAIFEELWTKAAHGSAAALERGECTVAEAQNDALSVFGQVVSYPLTLLTEKIGKLKGVPPEVAVSVALTDAKLRIGMAFNTAVEEIRMGDPFEEATQSARKWLLGQADIGRAADAAEREANEVSERLNAKCDPALPDGLHMASSLVARALIARAILQVGADWLAMETQMPADLARAALGSIVEELPDGLHGESFIKKELVQ